MKVYAAVARALQDNGVDTLFGLLGDANMLYVTDFMKEGGRYIGGVDERGVVLMAHGYARIGNRIGVASITHGPAVTNALTSLTEAARSRTAMLVITGDTPAIRDHIQHIDLPSLVGPTGALYQRVHNAAEVIDDVAIAIRRAIAARLPLVLDLPVDLLVADVAEAQSRFGPVPTQAVMPDENALDRALGVIASARRPVVIAGRGAVLGESRKELLQLADSIGAPLATTLLARDYFRGEAFDLGVIGTVAHDVAVGILAESDCVIAFGAGLNRFTAAEGSAFVGKAVVQIDTDAAVFGAYTPVDAAVLGDARIAAKLMADQLRAAGHQPALFRSAQMAAALAGYDPRNDFKDVSTETTLDVRAAMIRLDELLPADRTVVTDVGRFVAAPWRYLHVKDPLGFAHAASFGSIGLGTAMGIGAAAVNPTTRWTLVIAGDGGAMMGIVEFTTAVRHRLPLVLVVVNDGSYGAEWNKLNAFGVDSEYALIAWPDFAEVGRALGGFGSTVRTMADLERVSDRIANSEFPLLVDLKVDPSVDIGLLA
ncbi:thiamine pyrophosphate-binding protein [Rhodococcus opacus]|uniref:thiamine pyrophosphate-binding protein n=1 Tax=Rhodococcus opacus TaxID=37919 RepID=UPI0024BB4926|nr:thiamine pyrophosphate-binding protein [Rhodococcus opacus]MDJ0420017.1 thiamine pyrophosphate-binding protein [Rhodococcus opacus]